MTDRTDREFYPPRVHGIGSYACVGAFDLKCEVHETYAARVGDGFGFLNDHL